MKIISAIVALIFIIAASFVFADEAALVTNIPGLPGGQLPNGGKMYSGYFPLSDGGASYYQFYTAENEYPWASNHVSLWQTGGPGCSSIGDGAFQEVGPLRPDFNGNGSTLKYNPYTWSKFTNLLLIDAPRCVGYSRPGNNYSYPYATGDLQTSKDYIQALQEFFFKSFPEMQGKKFFIHGESYGGHYSLALIQQLQSYNAGVPSAQQINLTGWTDGNAWTDPETEAFGVVDTWWYQNVISESVYSDINQYCTYREITSWIINNVTVGARGFTQHGWETIKEKLYRDNVIKRTRSSEACFAALQKGSLKQFGNIDILNIGGDVCVKGTKGNIPDQPNWCAGGQAQTYLNLPEVRQAFHIVDPPPQGFTGCVNPGVMDYNQLDTQHSYFPVVQAAVASNKYKIMYYSGTFDLIVPQDSTRRWVSKMVKNLNLPIVNDFHEWFANTNGEQVGGWSTQYANGFTFATTRGAAHVAPFNQPQRMFHLLRSYFVNGTI